MHTISQDDHALNTSVVRSPGGRDRGAAASAEASSARPDAGAAIETPDADALQQQAKQLRARRLIRLLQGAIS